MGSQKSRPAPPIRLQQTSIADIADGLKYGRFTSVDVVETYIARINQVNPEIRAISEINPEAIAIAQERDDERADGRDRGVLHGVPVLLKDIFSTTDKLRTTVGCSGLLGAKSALEATVVKKLRESGAIILGKTVPTQWANYRSPSQASGGWSSVGGQCIGVFHHNQYASGSSSGSAVAAAIGLASAALGTETAGSITNPASRSAVVGLKPTVGLTSRYGVYCVSEWQDSAGVLAQNVKDAALVLSAIAGVDENDTFTFADPRDHGHPARPDEGTDFTRFCMDDGLKGLRIAVPRHVMSDDDVVTGSFNEALKILETLGATIVDNVEFSEWNPKYSKTDKEGWKLAFRVAIRKNMEAFLRTFSENPKQIYSLADLIEYTRITPEERNEEFGMTEWLAAERVGSRYDESSDEFKESLRRRNRMGGQIPELLDRYDCDLILVTGATETTSNVGGCLASNLWVGGMMTGG
ncbi:Amidase [Lasiodiplodia theobromae]|uniref:Amidase n=1 Tax=Lasiodiplodia theobromae TaxID=45133 RepID=UPI0015C2E869|nr:Amidase [Lasiodiplodia theobromae]KAF4546384.1 Amidase [Lasiodiplodia theobromae]